MANQLFVLDPLLVVNASLPIMDVDFSTFTSDGRYPLTMSRPNERTVLDLSQVFNINGHGSRLFGMQQSACLLVSIPNPDVHHKTTMSTSPATYAAFNSTTLAGHTIVERWGHAGGRPFTALQGFSVHVVTASLGACRCTLCIVPCPSSEGSPGSLSQGRDSTPDSVFPATPSATGDSVSVQVVESDWSGLKGGKKWTSIQEKAKFHKKCNWFIHVFLHW